MEEPNQLSPYSFNAKLHFLCIFFSLSFLNPDLCHSDAKVFRSLFGGGIAKTKNGTPC